MKNIDPGSAAQPGLFVRHLRTSSLLWTALLMFVLGGACGSSGGSTKDGGTGGDTGGAAGRVGGAGGSAGSTATGGVGGLAGRGGASGASGAAGSFVNGVSSACQTCAGTMCLTQVEACAGSSACEMCLMNDYQTCRSSQNAMYLAICNCAKPVCASCAAYCP
jgi:hypothetical protein